ncbi:FtsX-like permease family protein [Demequina iriomotensis]|uniref:FtsX-like permease family protein n=1 Tax=Demequina iriomotensis TaxID=1536641 RepID=UPI0007844543|nr:FtsX-like permease family protein [Demequina iriomotensis]
MRNAASWAVAVGGMAAGMVIPPLWPGDDGFATFIAPAELLVPPIVIVVATVTGVLRAAHLVTRRAELASRRAMGQSRRALLARAALDGLAAGAVWGVGALLLGSIGHQLIEGFGTGSPDWYALGLLGWAWLGLALGACLGWTLAAAWATHRAPRDDAEGTARARRRRPRWIGVAIVLALVPLSQLAIPWTEDMHGWPVGVIAIVSALGAYVAIPALLLRWGSALGVRIAARAAGALARGASLASARGLAADALVRPAPLRAAAIGAIAFVVAVATGAGVWVNGLAERNAVAESLAPDAVVATVTIVEPHGQAGTGKDEGWAPALDAAVVAELAADDRLVLVPAAALTAARGDTVIALEPDALDGLAPHGLRALFLDEGVAIGYGLGPVTVGEVQAEIEAPSAPAPFAAVERGWAEETFGAAPKSALLVYLASSVPRGDRDEGDSVEVLRILAEHDLGGAAVTPVNDSFGGTGRIDARGLITVAGPFLLGAVAIVVVLAAATQRLRAREHATLVALGAQAATMRAAAALEAAVVTAVGAALGLAAGTVLGAALAALNGAGGWALRLWNVGFDLAQAPWAALAGLVLLAVAAAAGLAALIRVRADAMTPAEQLREAEKEGVA